MRENKDLNKPLANRKKKTEKGGSINIIPYHENTDIAVKLYQVKASSKTQRTPKM